MSLSGRIIKRAVIKFVKKESLNLLGIVKTQGQPIDSAINAAIVGNITKIQWSSMMIVLLLKFMGLIGMKLPEEKK